MKTTRTPSTKEERRRWKGAICIWAKLGLFLLIIGLSYGCSLGGRTYIVKQYLLEYPSPGVEGLVPTNELIKVEHFFVAQAFNTPSMIYQEGPFNYQPDPYNRWMVSPGDLVSDYLVRDLRKAGLFRAVYSSPEIGIPRYVLDGTVEEFALTDQGGPKALLALSVMLLDLTKKEMPQKVIFQRQYQYTEPLTEKASAGFARAMSKAMEAFSRQLITDLSQTVSGKQ